MEEDLQAASDVFGGCEEWVTTNDTSCWCCKSPTGSTNCRRANRKMEERCTLLVDSPKAGREGAAGPVMDEEQALENLLDQLISAKTPVPAAGTVGSEEFAHRPGQRTGAPVMQQQTDSKRPEENQQVAAVSGRSTSSDEPNLLAPLSSFSDLDILDNLLDDDEADEFLKTIALEPTHKDEEGELTETALEALMEHHMRRRSTTLWPTPQPQSTLGAERGFSGSSSPQMGTFLDSEKSHNTGLSDVISPIDDHFGSYADVMALGTVGADLQVVKKHTSQSSALGTRVEATSILAPIAIQQGKALAKMRSMVSQTKVRYQADGFDLDLTYITPRVIAMGFPAHGREAYFRNPVDEVERFFELNHRNRYFIYNLCAERDYDSPQRFNGRYRRLGFEDHNAPWHIRLITDFVQDATHFLSENPENVVAVHCKAGKGRTGLMVACLLLALDPHMAPDAQSALEWFGNMRTTDGVGVTIPSQKRYVGYYCRVLRELRGKLPPPRLLHLYQINVTSTVKTSGPVDLYFTVEQSNVVRADSRKLFPRGPQRDRQGMVFVFPEPLLALQGDIRIRFFQRNAVLADEALFHFWLNVSLCNLHERLSKRDGELDGKASKSKDDSFCRELCVDVFFILPEGESSHAASESNYGVTHLSATGDEVIHGNVVTLDGDSYDSCEMSESRGRVKASPGRDDGKITEDSGDTKRSQDKGSQSSYGAPTQEDSLTAATLSPNPPLRGPQVGDGKRSAAVRTSPLFADPLDDASLCRGHMNGGRVCSSGSRGGVGVRSGTGITAQDPAQSTSLGQSESKGAKFLKKFLKNLTE